MKKTIKLIGARGDPMNVGKENINEKCEKIIEYVGQYGGANEYYGDKGVVGKFKKSKDLLPIYLDGIDKLRKITPNDFRFTPPASENDLEDSISDLILELLNYVRGNLRYCEVIRRETVIYFICDYHHPKVVLFCYDIISNLLDRSSTIQNLGNQIDQIFALCKMYHPDYQASFLISYAIRENLYYSHLGRRRWIFGTGVESKIFFETSLLDDLINRTLDLSKKGCKNIFQEARVSSPKYTISQTEGEALSKIGDLSFPLVVKPSNGSKGKGVTANIRSIPQLKNAITYALANFSGNDSIILEEHVRGLEYRFTCVDGKIVAVTNRRPPYVVGNGFKTIKQLIAQCNASRTINLRRSLYLRPIKIDETVESILESQGYTFDDIVADGVKVRIRENSNVSSGGSYVSPNFVNPNILDEVRRIMNQVPYFSFGIDYITTDISKKSEDAGGAFLEINETPGTELLTAQGYGSADIGRCFLRKCENRKEIDIYIYNDISEIITTQHYAEDTIILPNYVLDKRKIKRVTGVSSHFNIADHFLANPNSRLNILISESYFTERGLPVIPNSKVYIGNDVSGYVTETISKTEITYYRFPE